MNAGEPVRRPQRGKPSQAAPTVQPAPPDPFYGHEEVARICALFITSLFSCPDFPTQSAPPAHSGSGPPPAPPPPAPPLANFIAYALHRTRLHACVTFTALFLLQRLKTRFPAARGSSGHRLFISAFMIASKVVCDDMYSNKSWCVVGQGMFSLKEINQMEREMCNYLEWKLNFNPAELAEFEVKVRRDHSRTSPASSARPQVPHIVTASAQAQAQPHKNGSYPSPPDSPNTPASASAVSPPSATLAQSDDGTSSVASSRSSMFSNQSTSTLATSMASSSIRDPIREHHARVKASSAANVPGYAYASRCDW